MSGGAGAGVSSCACFHSFVIADFCFKCLELPDTFFPAQGTHPQREARRSAAVNSRRPALFFVLTYCAPAHPSSRMTTLNDLGSWVAWLRLCTGSSGCPSGVLPSGAAAGPMSTERVIPPPSSKIRRVARSPRTFFARLYVRTFAVQILGVLEPRISNQNFKFVICPLWYW